MSGPVTMQGRKLNQHFIKMRATSTIAWSLIWSAAPGLSSNGILGTAKSHGFLGNGFLNATEPFTGHYDVPPVLWINAHWHQFAQPGWRFLRNSTSGGSGWLPGGGSYVTLVPPEGSSLPANTFTMIVETLVGTCGSTCNSDPITETQTLSFALKGPLASARAVAVWCSSEPAVFAKQPQVDVSDGVLRLTMKPDTLCTARGLRHHFGPFLTCSSAPNQPLARCAPCSTDYSSAMLTGCRLVLAI